MVAPAPSCWRCDPQDLRGFLARHDVPCPGCGYNLRGLPTDRCPECARFFALAELTAPAPVRARPVPGDRGSVWKILLLVALVNGMGRALMNPGGPSSAPMRGPGSRGPSIPAYGTAFSTGAPGQNGWLFPGRSASSGVQGLGDAHGSGPAGRWPATPPAVPSPWNSGVPGGPGPWASPGAAWPGRAQLPGSDAGAPW